MVSFTVDEQIHHGTPRTCAADAEEDIMERDGVFCVHGLAGAGPHLKQDG